MMALPLTFRIRWTDNRSSIRTRAGCHSPPLLGSYFKHGTEKKLTAIRIEDKRHMRIDLFGTCQGMSKVIAYNKN